MDSPRQYKILVVEDHNFMCQLLKSRLRASGYHVFTAANGEEGVETAKQEVPDLILMDVNMPRMNGFEAGRIIKTDPKTQSIPIIFVTARGDEKDIFRAINQLHSVSYIIKPFKPEDLLEEVKRALPKD